MPHDLVIITSKGACHDHHNNHDVKNKPTRTTHALDPQPRRTTQHHHREEEQHEEQVRQQEDQREGLHVAQLLAQVPAYQEEKEEAEARSASELAA